MKPFRFFRGDEHYAAFMVRTLKQDFNNQNRIHLHHMFRLLTTPQGSETERRVLKICDEVTKHCSTNKKRYSVKVRITYSQYGVIAQTTYIKSVFPFFLDAAVVVAQALNGINSKSLEFQNETKTAIHVWRDDLHLPDPVNYDILYGILKKNKLFD